MIDKFLETMDGLQLFHSFDGVSDVLPVKPGPGPGLPTGSDGGKGRERFRKAELQDVAGPGVSNQGKKDRTVCFLLPINEINPGAIKSKTKGRRNNEIVD